MDHQYIADHNLVERYLSRRLPAGERAAFEDHFVTCTECLDAIELAQEFQDSLRAGVAQEVTRQTVQAGLLAWLARPAGRAVLAAALALILAVPAVWFGLGQGGTGALAPQVNVPTYTLGMVRSGEDGPVLTASSQQWLTLLLDADEGFAEYRLSLKNVFEDTASNSLVWQESGIPSDAQGRVSVTFPPGSLEPGEYRLDLAGLDAAGAASELQSHRVRLTD